MKETKNPPGHPKDTVLKAMPKIGRWAMKRTFDLIVSFISLLILFPLFALIAAIVKLGSKGPVIIGHKRVGLGYNTFDLYKFRTTPGINSDAGELNFDRFLEASGLNELPSLINVLKGDISLVGSRPLLLSEAGKLTKEQFAIRMMAPIGMTGLWRIKGMRTVAESYETDMEYATANSFWIDVKILFLTFLAFPLNQRI